MSRERLQETHLPRNWDAYSLDNYPFCQCFEALDPVDEDTFLDWVDVDDFSRLDTDESWQDWLEYCGDVEFYLSTYHGHVVASIKAMGTPIYFTPKGLEPGKLPPIGQQVEHVIKYVDREPFDMTGHNIPGSLVVHGTDAAGLASIAAEGINHDKTYAGYLGKGLYTTGDFKYALGNYARLQDDSDDLTASGLVLLQVKPNARIACDGDAAFDYFQDHLSDEHLPDLLKAHGYDGLYCPAMSALAIHNPDAVTVLNTFVTQDVLQARQRLLDSQHTLTP